MTGLTHRGIPTDPVLWVLAAATLVNTLGNGAVMTTTALYFTRVVGLTATQVALALSVGAAVALVTQVPLGHLGDVRGPREVLRLLIALTGVATLGLTLVRSPWQLVVVLGLEALVDRGASAVRNGYVARAATGGRGVAFKAYLRSTTNVGISLGALLGGLALAVDTRWAFLAVFVVNALTFFVTALVLGRLPHLAPAPARAVGEPRLAVLRDTPYAVVSLLVGIYSMHFFVIELAVPLWVSTHTSAPTWVVAATMLVNTVAVAAFQVRLARGSDTVPAAARLMARSGVWVVAGFAVIPLASGVPAWLAVALLLAGAGLHVVGEMTGSGGQWGVQMGLAPAERQGQYQGFAGLSFSLASIAAPPLVAVLCIGWGRPGWLVLGGIILLAGVLVVPASTWALRTRTRYGVLTHSG
ncbi:MFS transporter [Lapillicoccus jejuensis]|uniref:MFS transporter n=1 Tax=Lapillicoccus jejuensis TaxID=402171 RepID=A0A542E6A0_9MICO|nr:MFS transporter [Lapillicoccus jejuensis]TQJ10851.1 MFS transporter [Lapillicoccus jejuensis]